MEAKDGDAEPVRELTREELNNYIKTCFTDEEYDQLSSFQMVKYRVLCSSYLTDRNYLNQYTLKDFLTRKIPSPHKLYPHISGSPRKYPAPDGYDNEFWNNYSDSSSLSDEPNMRRKSRKVTLEEMWDQSDDDHRLERAVRRERALLAAKRRPRGHGIIKKEKPPPKKRGRKRKAPAKPTLKPAGASNLPKRKRRTKAELKLPIGRAENAAVTRAQSAALRGEVSNLAAQKAGPSGVISKSEGNEMKPTTQTTEVVNVSREIISKDTFPQIKVKDAVEHIQEKCVSQKAETKLIISETAASKNILKKRVSELNVKAEAVRGTKRGDTKRTIRQTESSDINEDMGVGDDPPAKKKKMPRRSFIPPPPPTCFYNKTEYMEDDIDEYLVPDLPNPSFRDVYYAPLNTCQCIPGVSTFSDEVMDLTEDKPLIHTASTSGPVNQRLELPAKRHLPQRSSHIPILPPPLAPFSYKRVKYTSLERSASMGPSTSARPTTNTRPLTSFRSFPSSRTSISDGPSTSTVLETNSGISTSSGLSTNDERTPHASSTIADSTRNTKLITSNTRFPAPPLTYYVSNTKNPSVPKSEQENIKPIMGPGFYVQRTAEELSDTPQANNAHETKSDTNKPSTSTRSGTLQDKEKNSQESSKITPNSYVPTITKNVTAPKYVKSVQDAVNPQQSNSCSFMVPVASPRVSFAVTQSIEREKRMQPKRKINRKKFIVAYKPQTIVISDKAENVSPRAMPRPLQVLTQRQNIITANEAGFLKVVPNINRDDISRRRAIASIGQENRPTKIKRSDSESPNIDNSAGTKPIIKKSAVIPASSQKTEIRVPPHLKPCPSHCPMSSSQTKPRLAVPMKKQSNIIVRSQVEPTILSTEPFRNLPKAQSVIGQQAHTETSQDIVQKDIKTYQGPGKREFAAVEYTQKNINTERKKETSDSHIPIVLTPDRTSSVPTSRVLSPPNAIQSAKSLITREITIVPLSQAQVIRPDIKPMVTLYPIVKSTVRQPPKEPEKMNDRSGSLSTSDEDQEIITIQFPPNVDQSRVRAILSARSKQVPYIRTVVPSQQKTNSTEKQISRNVEPNVVHGNLIRIPRSEVRQICPIRNVTSSLSKKTQSKVTPVKAELVPVKSFLRRALESPQVKTYLPKTVQTLSKTQSETKTIAVSGCVPSIFESRTSTVNTQTRTAQSVQTLSSTSSVTQSQTESITMLETLSTSRSTTLISRPQIGAYVAKTLETVATTSNTTIVSQSQIKISTDTTGNAIEAQYQIKTAALTQIKQNTSSSGTEKQEVRTIAAKLEPIKITPVHFINVPRIQVIRNAEGEIKAIHGPDKAIKELTQIQQAASANQNQYGAVMANKDMKPSISTENTMLIRRTGDPVLPSGYPYRNILTPIRALPQASTSTVTEDSMVQGKAVLSATRLSNLHKLLAEVHSQCLGNKIENEIMEQPWTATTLTQINSTQSFSIARQRSAAPSTNQSPNFEISIENEITLAETRTMMAPTSGTSTSTVSRLSRHMKVLSPICTSSTKTVHAVLPPGYSYSTQSGSTKISLVRPGLYEVVRSGPSSCFGPRFYTADEMLAAEVLTALDVEPRRVSYTRPLTNTTVSTQTIMSTMVRTPSSAVRPAIEYMSSVATPVIGMDVTPATSIAFNVAEERTTEVEEAPKYNQDMMGK